MNAHSPIAAAAPVTKNLTSAGKGGTGYITKEIAKGILLHKKNVTPKNTDEGYEMVYRFLVEVKALQVVEFTADFTGSERCVLDIKSTHDANMRENTPLQHKENNMAHQDKGAIDPNKGNPMVITTTINPNEIMHVAVVKLMKNWKLKSKFRFTMKNPPIEFQRKCLLEYNLELQKVLEASKKAYDAQPFSIMPVEQISDVLRSTKVPYIDLEFLPLIDSIYDKGIESPFDIEVHWQRPHDFLKADESQGLYHPSVFYETIEPNDVQPGILGDGWFISALACLAERPALIERLFLTKELNQQDGFYRVKICKNGEWVIVTVDDYIPCFPKAGPLFSRAHGNELWVMLLEKAYAKLHGNYYLLKGGFANEALMDLTGCPTVSYDFHDEYVQHLIQNGKFWDLIKYFDDQGFLMSVSAAGEGRWSDAEGQNEADPTQLPLGYSFSVILVKEIAGNLLLNIRNPYGNFEWTGDWCDGSPMWTPALREQLLPNNEESDGTFWIAFQDILKYFKSLNVCRVRNWEEVRIKGKFIRVQDIDDLNIEVVLSKWYYSIDLHEPTNIFIGLHQEDERIKGVLARRPYLDISIAILRRTNDGVVLVDLKDFVQDRQCEIEVNLEAGSYIILPRTSGCTLRRPPNASKESIKLIDQHGSLNELFEATISDIFRKFDMLLNRELSYCEFKGFCECINENITEKQFQEDILGSFCSTQRGLTLKGFKEFFRKNLLERQTEEPIWQWLENLGYDRQLYSVRSRCFILTLHSEQELSVTVRDAIQTDLDTRTNLLIIEQFGQELTGSDQKSKSKRGYKILYTFSEQILAYSYAVQNLFTKPVDATLDCSTSQNMVFSSRGSKISKRIEAGQTEFMMHAVAMQNVEKFKRGAKCEIRDVVTNNSQLTQDQQLP